MAVVVIQMGHVPRTVGKTGTWREQELNRAIGERLHRLLTAAGHQSHLMGADDSLPVKRGDVFVALHGDSGNAQVARSGASTKRGASVGFPDANGARIGAAWRAAHAAAGWPGGFLGDNNTTAMSGYYMWSRTAGFGFRYLAEHATLTNGADEAWIFANLDRAAAAHGAAIGQVVNGGRFVVQPLVAGTTHTVQAGETLIGIGRKFGVDFRVIQRINGIVDANKIRVGQVLRIPGTAGPAPAGSPSRTHIVQPADTLIGIGRKFGVDFREIQRINGIVDANKIRVGQVLTIP
ncbi:MAG: LysM peptidoglycan-binding domain-containing protein [Acidimicrobiales bacterium]